MLHRVNICRCCHQYCHNRENSTSCYYFYDTSLTSFPLQPTGMQLLSQASLSFRTAAVLKLSTACALGKGGRGGQARNDIVIVLMALEIATLNKFLIGCVSKFPLFPPSSPFFPRPFPHADSLSVC